MIGFPSLSLGSFVWPVRRVRWQYWKLHYFEGPTGYAGMQGSCYLGDSTSATRLVAANTVLAAGEAGGSAFLSAIDLAALRQQRATSVWPSGRPVARVLTCPYVVNYEPDWLPHARLSEGFAIAHQVEAARWVPEPVAPQVHCLVLSADVARRLVSFQGVVTPWCFRRHLDATIKDICNWWSKRDAANAVVPASEGSMLTVIRGSRPMPWDHDADIVLLSRNEFQLRQHSAQIASELKDRGCSFWIRGDAPEDGFVCAEVECVGVDDQVSAVIDLFVQGGERESELRTWAKMNLHQTRLLGSRVHVDPRRIIEMAGDPRFGPKLMRARDRLKPLQCFATGHNACLPNCLADVRDCEFQDNFVLADSWLE